MTLKTYIVKPLIGPGVCPYCLAWQHLFCRKEYNSIIQSDFFLRQFKASQLLIFEFVFLLEMKTYYCFHRNLNCLAL